MRFSFFFILVFTSVNAFAANRDYATTSVRAIMIVAQELFASPPLPSTSADKDFHLSLQAAHVKAKAEGSATEDDIDIGEYTSTTKGYGLSIGFTSPSKANFSYFLLGSYSSLQGDYIASMTDKSKLTLSDLNTKSIAGGAGLNYIILGSERSPLALSLFAGGLYFTLKSSYTSTLVTTATFSSYQLATNSNHGPFVGTQLKIHMGWFGLTPYAYYYSDMTDHCVRFEEVCQSKLDNSFTVLGLKVGLGKFSISAYTNLYRKLPDGDTNTTMLQLGYTLDL